MFYFFKNVIKFFFIYIFVLSLKYEVIFFQDKLIIYYNLIHNHPGYYNNNDYKFKNKINELIDLNKPIYIFTEFLYYFFLSIKIDKIFQDSSLKIFIKKYTTVKDKNTEFQWHYINDSILYIFLDSFDYNLESAEILLNALKDLDWKKINTIYFNLQGNTSDNDLFGALILQGIFGYKDYLEKIKKFYDKNPEECLWLCSKENCDYLKKLLCKSRIIKNRFENITLQMEKKIYNNEIFLIEKKPFIKSKLTSFNFDFKGNIICMINYQCDSAVLDFIDELMILKNNKVLLIGEKTKSDGCYMGKRNIPLSIPTFFVTMPIKMYLEKKLRSYDPHIHIDLYFD